MNTKSIVTAGMVAGLVVAAANVLFQVAYGAGVSSTPLGVSVMRWVASGFGVVILYALIQPRLGPGHRTAIATGLFAFLFGVLFPPFDAVVSRASNAGMLLTYVVWSAIGLTMAAVAGGWFYERQGLSSHSIEGSR